MVNDTSKRQVWKFPVEFSARFSLPLPKGAEVLHFDMQGTMPTLWALVDPEAEIAPRDFFLRGTGHDIPSPEDLPLKHIGTCLEDGGRLVWHLFEVLS